MTAVKMPQLGETVIEGTILKWLKQEGDQVALDEPLFEISTDKVDTEVPSSAAGTLTKILVAEGETVAVGTELAEISEAGDGWRRGSGSCGAARCGRLRERSGLDRRPPGAPMLPPLRPHPLPLLRPSLPRAVTEPSDLPSPRWRLRRRRSSHHPIGGSGRRSCRRWCGSWPPSTGWISGRWPGPGRVGASPRTTCSASSPREAMPHPLPRAPPRRLLFTSPAPAVAPQPAPAVAPQPAPAAVGGGEEIVPVSHIRKQIAQHMKASLEVSARAWNAVEVNMENVARLRERTKEAFKAREGFSLTYMPFLTRAVTEALLANPMVNSELRGEEIAVKHFVNMGIAVSYDEGLIVPVLKGTDTMNLLGIARGINDLATRARAKKLQPDEVHGGTFTITNPGPFGSLISVPIINQPQTGILGFDSVEKRPVVIDDTIAIRHMVYISMSWDHRVIDGALASQFLARVKQNLETWDFAEDLAL